MEGAFFSHYHVSTEYGSYILMLAYGNVTTFFAFNLVIFFIIIIIIIIILFSFKTKSLYGLPKSGLISETA